MAEPPDPKGGVPDLSTSIGRHVTVEDSVTAQAVARYRATLGSFLALGEDGEAPLGFHWCLAPDAFTPERLGPDGHVA